MMVCVGGEEIQARDLGNEASSRAGIFAQFDFFMYPQCLEQGWVNTGQPIIVCWMIVTWMRVRAVGMEGSMWI